MRRISVPMADCWRLGERTTRCGSGIRSPGSVFKRLPLGETVQTLAFSPDGRLLAVGCMGRVGVRESPDDRRQFQCKLVYETKPDDGGGACRWRGRNVLMVGTWPGAANMESRCGKCPRAHRCEWKRVLELDRSRCLATVFNYDRGLLGLGRGNSPPQSLGLRAGQEAPLHAPDMNQGWNGLALLPDRTINHLYVEQGRCRRLECQKRSPRRRFWYTRYVCRAAGRAEPQWNYGLPALTQLDTVSIWHRPTGKHVFTLRPNHCRRLVSGLGSFQRTPSCWSVRRRTGGLASGQNPRETG